MKLKCRISTKIQTFANLDHKKSDKIISRGNEKYLGIGGCKIEPLLGVKEAT